MDSPHDEIEVWWPVDGPSFSTRANELLLRRSAENASLLGSNLRIPDLSGASGNEHIVNVEDQIKEAEAGEREPWDGILDALEPVRQLVSGPKPLITPQLYNQLRQEGAHRVLARVSPLRTARPWAFLAVAGSADGAPRWLFLDGPGMKSTSSLEHTCARLREELAQGPPNHMLDDDALALLDKALDAATRSEFNDLPRRMRRALEQMGAVLPAWVVNTQRKGDELAGQRLREVARLTQIAGQDNPVDPYLVAGRWLTLVSPVLDAFQRQHRRRPFVLLSDIPPGSSPSRCPLPTSFRRFRTSPIWSPWLTGSRHAYLGSRHRLAQGSQACPRRLGRRRASKDHPPGQASATADRRAGAQEASRSRERRTRTESVGDAKEDLLDGVGRPGR